MGAIIDRRDCIVGCVQAVFSYGENEYDYINVMGGKIRLVMSGEDPYIEYESPKDLVNRALTYAIGAYLPRMIRPGEVYRNIFLQKSGTLEFELFDKGTCWLIIDSPWMNTILSHDINKCRFEISDQIGIRKLLSRLLDGYPTLKIRVRHKKWSIRNLFE